MLIVIGLVVIPISMVLAAVVVDASVWQSERRGAQKDADLAALAGAYELIGPAGNAANADAAARANLADNDEAGNGGSKAGNIKNLIIGDCDYPGGGNHSVSVDLNHESQTFFASIFGLSVAPDIGAHAKACAGAAQSAQGIVPIETDLSGACFTTVNGTPTPRIAQACPIEYDSHGSNPRGILDLQAGGDYCSDARSSGDIEDMILNGAPGICKISRTGTCDPDKNGPWYDCVGVQPGNPTNVQRGFRDRIAREGACDTDGDGVEEWDEVLTLASGTAGTPSAVYEPRDCDPNTDGVQMSPRLITIIVLREYPDGSNNTGYPIYAFAGMYVEGCNTDSSSDATLDPKCNVSGAELAPADAGAGYVEVAPTGGGTHFTSLNMADCGNGAKKTPCPTNTPVPTNTPTFTRTPTYTRTPTRTPTPTFTPGPPTNTPTPGNSGPCGHGNQPTCVPTPTPGGPTATPTPGGGGGGGNGNIVVWGKMVNLIFTNVDVGAPTDATTIFSISLVQ
jgi:hypothetical protein